MNTSVVRHSQAIAARIQFLPGTTLLAWRNLTHDRARFFVTLIGIVFAVVLMGAQLGLLVGFAKTASTLVDHAAADLWITPEGTSNVDIAGRLPLRRKYDALAVPGVASVDTYMVQFAFWRKSDGGTESVSVVGFDPASGRGAPWALRDGKLSDLDVDDAVIVDRLYWPKLGVHDLGQTVEINRQRVRVVGATQGIRTFTQSPHVFTTHTRAQRLALFSDYETTYLLVTLAADADRDQVRQALQRQLPHVQVWTKQGFALQTQYYWLVTTGAGGALLLAAALGLIVGIVIVGQTLYATTVDRLPEYATLRAIGASNRYLYRVILKQAAISAALGYVLGLTATLVMVWSSQGGNIAMQLPWWLALLLGALTGLMCALGALASIRRVMTIDPTTVFQ